MHGPHPSAPRILVDLGGWMETVQRVAALTLGVRPRGYRTELYGQAATAARGECWCRGRTAFRGSWHELTRKFDEQVKPAEVPVTTN